MKASELSVDGFYWCTHELCCALSPGEQYQRQWDVVQRAGDRFYFAGADVDVRASDVPDYVQFTGPLAPPED